MSDFDLYEIPESEVREAEADKEFSRWFWWALVAADSTARPHKGSVGSLIDLAKREGWSVEVPRWPLRWRPS